MAEHRCNKSKKKGKIRLTKMADGAIGVVVVCFFFTRLFAFASRSDRGDRDVCVWVYTAGRYSILSR